MNSMPVKNTGTAVAALPVTQTRPAANVSFQDVWSKQTSQDKVPQTKPSDDYLKKDKAAEKLEGTTEPGDLQEQDHIRDDAAETEEPAANGADTEKENVREPQAADGKDHGGNKEMDGTAKDQGEQTQTPEEILEALGSAAAAFLQQVAEELGISGEELSGMLDKLGMDAVDLLDADSLTKLVLTAGGSGDSMALLTDEALYQNMKNLSGRLEDLLADCKRDLNLTPQELDAVMQKLKNGQTQEDIPAGRDGEPDLMILTEPAKPEAPEGMESQKAREIPVQTAAQEDAPEEPASPDMENRLNTAAETTVREGAGDSHSAEDRGGRDTNQDKNQNTNPFVQTLNEGLKETAAAPHETAPAAGRYTQTQDIMRQIMDYMKIQLKPDMSNLEMQLHPERLGSIRIQISAREGAVTAQFIAQNESVKAALESQMVQLRESFAEQGVKVEAIEVSVQAHQFERNLDQGSGRGHEPGERRSRGRRINLNLSMDGAEELSEDEQLAVDMMTANGSTVDYTV